MKPKKKCELQQYFKSSYLIGCQSLRLWVTDATKLGLLDWGKVFWKEFTGMTISIVRLDARRSQNSSSCIKLRSVPRESCGSVIVYILYKHNFSDSHDHPTTLYAQPTKYETPEGVFVLINPIINRSNTQFMGYMSEAQQTCRLDYPSESSLLGFHHIPVIGMPSNTK